MKSWLSKRFASKVSSQTSRDNIRDLTIPADQIFDLGSQIQRISFEFSKSQGEKHSLPLSAFLSVSTPSHLILSDGAVVAFFNLDSSHVTQKSYDSDITFMFFCPESNSLLLSGSQVLRISMTSFEVLEVLPIQTSFIIQSKDQKLCIINENISILEDFPRALYQHEEAIMIDCNDEYLASLSPRLLLVYKDSIVFRYENFSTNANFLKCSSSFLAVSGEFYCVLIVKFGTWQTFQLFEQLSNDQITWLDFKDDYLIAASGYSVLMQDLAFKHEPWVLETGSKKIRLAGFLSESSCYSCSEQQLTIFHSFNINERLDRTVVEIPETIKGFTLFKGSLIVFSQSKVWRIDENDYSVNLLIHSDLKSEIFDIFGGRDKLYVSQKEGIFVFIHDFSLARRLEIPGAVTKIGEIGEILVVLLPNSVVLVSTDDGNLLHELSYYSVSPTAWAGLDHQLFIGDSEGGIKLWDLNSGNSEKSLNGHNRKLKSLSINPELSLLLSTDGSSSVKIWNLSTLHCFYSIYSNNCKQVLTFGIYSIIRSDKKKIAIFDLNDFSLVTCLESKSKIELIQLVSDKIVAKSRNSLLFFNNPLLTKQVQVFGLNLESVPVFKRTLNRCLRGGTWKNAEKFETALISPYNLNLLILSAYLNDKQLMERQVRCSSLHPTTGGETGISVCMSKNFIDLTSVIFKSLKEKLVENPHCLFYLESNIVELNKRSVPGLSQLYKLALGRSKTQNLPRFCIESKNLPITVESSSFSTVPSDFMQITDYSTQGKAINFSQTLIKINNTLGSSESIEFLDSLLVCSSIKIFKTGLIRLILNEKWKKVKIILLVQGTVYAALTVLIALFVTVFRTSEFLLAPFLVSKVLMVYEIYQLAVCPLGYLTDVWNLIDFTRAGLFLAYSVRVWTGHDSNELLAVTIALTWSRGITYFRLFAGTRYYINLLFEVIRDMASFFVIFFYSIVGFALIFFVLAADSEFFEYLTSTYTLNFGNMETGSYDKLEWLFFLLVTVFNPIVMLNLLISIMGNTFDRVKSNFETADLIELCALIKEVELLIFWNRGEKHRFYLHVCDKERTGDRVAGSEKYLKDINRTMKEMTRLVKAGHEMMTRGLSNSQVLFGNLNSSITEIKSKLVQRR